MLKIYSAPKTCALASHIALEEAGADYETVRMSFQTEDQKKPGYLAINSKARVPSLVTDKGVLTETPAILAWRCARRGHRYSGRRKASAFGSPIGGRSTGHRNTSARTWKRCASRLAISLLIERLPLRMSEMRLCGAQSAMSYCLRPCCSIRKRRTSPGSALGI